jgi:hypothetical protein
MPYIPHTPEALLPRSDSKNPAATCRGLTSSGRPCRRAIAGSPGSSKSKISSNPSLHDGSPETFCWQHKDQAAMPGRAFPQGLQNTTIKERTSVDTLIDRLGLLEVEEQSTPSKKKQSRPAKPIQLTPLQSQQEDGRVHVTRPPASRERHFGIFCCFIGEVDDVNAAPKPIRRPPAKTEKRPAQARHNKSSNTPPRRPQATDRLSPSPSPSRHSPSRPSIARDPSSRTAEFLSLIPKSTAPETTSLLLAELAKPVSTFDEEGYIYIFWLTSTAIPNTPPSEAASSLLEVPGRPEAGRRRPSDVLKSFSETKSDKDKTILLKIGRASNVHRRLNEWTRQCGYNLSLVRYYPYHSSSPRREEPPRTPRKVPHAHRVERLIHIELQGRRAPDSGKCRACGKDHREWFEVDASRDGVKAVDEVVRRWVDWALRGGTT